MQTFSTILRGGTVVSNNGIGLADIGLRDGKIAYIGDLSHTKADTDINLKGLHVLPGVIDSQVHFREPGATHKEDLATGSRAAVLGGVTAVFEMPNTSPTTTTLEAFAQKRARAEETMFCDYAFFFGASTDNISLLRQAENLLGCAGIKMFMGSSTGSLLVDDSEHVLQVLQNGRRRVSVHSEEESRLEARKHLRREGDASSHPEWRDPQAALECTQRLIGLARQAQRRIHVLHISTQDELEILAANKDIVTAEATPHHLTLDGDEAYKRLGTYVQMNPPVRGIAHRDAIFEAVRQGVIDVLGSDHAPHTREEKDKPYPSSPSGMPGVQTLVPIMLDHVHHGRLTLERFVDLTSHSQQRIFGIANKGRIAVGYDADFTIVDLKQQKTIENNWIASKCGWTPYDGQTVTGWPKGTFIREQQVMWNDEITATHPLAQPVRFQEQQF
jgi:dihydroorotase